MRRAAEAARRIWRSLRHMCGAILKIMLSYVCVDSAFDLLGNAIFAAYVRGNAVTRRYAPLNASALREAACRRQDGGSRIGMATFNFSGVD